MNVNYKKLWKLLIDREMKKSELKKLTGISGSTIAKMNKNEYVSMDVLVRICQALKCQLSDICEVELKDKANNI